MISGDAGASPAIFRRREVVSEGRTNIFGNGQADTRRAVQSLDVRVNRGPLTGRLLCCWKVDARLIAVTVTVT